MLTARVLLYLNTSSRMECLRVLAYAHMFGHMHAITGHRLRLVASA